MMGQLVEWPVRHVRAEVRWQRLLDRVAKHVGAHDDCLVEGRGIDHCCCRRVGFTSDDTVATIVGTPGAAIADEGARTGDVAEVVHVAAVDGESCLVDDEIGLLSVVGEGISREPGVAGRVFAILAEAGVNIDLISTSNLYITCVVPLGQLKEGAKALHAGLIEVG